MVVGNGQLAKSFQDYSSKEVLIFASGVSDSNCVDELEFEREKILLIDTLKKFNNKNKFVYFSSCALSAERYDINEYYKHKQNMENTIKKYSNNYYIFRIPQLFGDLIHHKTLINFLFNSIKNNNIFNIYDEAYRYVIEINDVKTIVDAYLTYHDGCTIIDVANPYSYKVLDIVKIFEKLLNKKARYTIIRKKDKYILDFTYLKDFMKVQKMELGFGEEYLMNKLKGKLC